MVSQKSKKGGRGPEPPNANLTGLKNHRLAHLQVETTEVKIEETVSSTVSISQESFNDQFIHPSRLKLSTEAIDERQGQNPKDGHHSPRPHVSQKDNRIIDHSPPADHLSIRRERDDDQPNDNGSLISPSPYRERPPYDDRRRRASNDDRYSSGNRRDGYAIDQSPPRDYKAAERDSFSNGRRRSGPPSDNRSRSRGRSTNGSTKAQIDSRDLSKDGDDDRKGKNEDKDISTFLDDLQHEFGQSARIKSEERGYDARRDRRRANRIDPKQEREAGTGLVEMHGNDWAKLKKETALIEPDPTTEAQPPESTGPKSRRSRKTFMHERSALTHAKTQYETIETNIYQYDGLGETSYQESMSCDCKPNITDGKNFACGEDSDCINRMTSMECTNDDCNCGDECGNQRFQRREYADVDVFETEKKGFGIRIMESLEAHQFIYEYVGEVIDEPTFRNRTREYHDDGIRHFYFMMLQAGKFLDATRLGGLGRFCNHSCNPNCYVDKWVVGSQLRMGIFAKRRIVTGEELTFDYNVDRYGADAQPCYCEEPNCIGYIGGKTQSEAQPKLSHTTLQGKLLQFFVG